MEVRWYGRVEMGRMVSENEGVTEGIPHREVARVLRVSQGKLTEFCRSHGISRMRLFGSVLREDFGPDSDIDILVEYAPDRTPGLDFFTQQDKLAEILGRRVDLHTPASLSRYFRDEVLREARTIVETPDVAA